MNLIKTRRNLLIHLLMAFMGGYAGMYGILVRGSFGQAVTSNLANVFRHLLLGDNIDDGIFRFGAILVFLFALGVTHILQMKDVRLAEITCLVSQTICILISAAIPENTAGALALYPIFFLTGIQWGTFTGAEGFNCSTIFCSNNSKQALFGWIDYVLTGKHESFKQGLFYTVTLIFFYVAVVISVFMSDRFGAPAILLELIPLSLAAIIWLINDRAAD
ncbi:MAG TPA: hypothetical protein DIW34_08155 [Oribacterium sp.]|nr:hypothetical protein [Oribacterium sp.]